MVGAYVIFIRSGSQGSSASFGGRAYIVFGARGGRKGYGYKSCNDGKFFHAEFNVKKFKI